MQVMGTDNQTISEEERRAVEVHKWFLSQRAQYDVGWDAAFEDWKLYHQAEWRRKERIHQLEDNTEQVQEIQKYIWVRSEQAGKDLSKDAETEWVQLYAAQWRDQAAHKTRKPHEGHESLYAVSDSCSYGTPIKAEWRHITVRNEKGLHVRPSMRLKKLLDEHPECDIYVQNMATNGGAIRIKEMTQILSLGAICGDVLLFGAAGLNATQVLDEIEYLFDSRFNDCC